MYIIQDYVDQLQELQRDVESFERFLIAAKSKCRDGEHDLAIAVRKEISENGGKKLPNLQAHKDGTVEWIRHLYNKSGNCDCCGGRGYDYIQENQLNKIIQKVGSFMECPECHIKFPGTDTVHIFEDIHSGIIVLSSTSHIPNSKRRELKICSI